MEGGCQAQNGRFVVFFGGGIDAIDAIDAIEAIEDMGFGGCGLGGMEENKKSGGGDVRAEALAWDDEWDKA